MFNNLFNKKKSVVEDKEFTFDFEDALKRYLGAHDEKVEYEFEDENGRIIPPSHAFKDVYNEWKTVQSVWDKRGVIFSGLDSIYLKELPKEQIIERFVIDRYPQKALFFVSEYSDKEDFQNPKFLASLAKCYFFLSDYDKSIEFANKALATESDNKKALIVLADSLHLKNQHNESHQIYDQILEKSKLKNWKNESVSIIELIGFSNNILNSSVYAVGLLSNNEVDENTWNKIAEEFYYCPYFRSQHAFWLLKKGESLKGMAKLLSTTQEFPWYKDAVIKAKSGIMQMREQMNSKSLWEEELKYLSDIIDEKNW